MSIPKRLRTALVAALAVVGLAAVSASAVVVSNVPSSYTALSPTRILDTRSGLGAPKAPVASHGAVQVSLTGVPAGATAVTLNVTETNAVSGGNLIVYPDLAARPTTSNLNFSVGGTVANSVTVPVGSDGKIAVYVDSLGSVDVIVDLEGYYTAAAPAYTPPTIVTQSATLNDGGVVGTANTGGSAVTNATDELDVALSAGTYQVSVNAKATPNGSTAANVDPQFFVYNQALAAGFVGNQFNLGSGALQNGTSHDAYFTGSGIVTSPSGGETLHVYAFGYDGDSGASTYTLDSLTLTAVPVAVPIG